MLHAFVNNSTFDIDWNKDKKSGLLNGQPFTLDRLELGNGKSHVIFNHKSYSVELLSFDKETKQAIISVNGVKYPVQLKDRFDDLLKSLGMEDAGQKKIKNVKAPMPGLVLNLTVNEGDTVEKDSPLLILEAMKMENVIKSPGAGVVKKINVNKGQAVEKGAPLIEFA